MMEMGSSTIMMCLFFGTNAILFGIFQFIQYYNKYNVKSELTSEGDDKKEKKELSKPFVGTIDCFINVTSEFFKTGLIMALTYICERHWIFEHSGKSYSRDLFMFVLILFFGYAYYTIKPVHDLTLLSREQTEEWKGWMQFIFLLYHYFHAEEVYNSVRVMITCYVWMTGFGNFQFFYVKQDYGWLRVAQMLWRLNFSVLLLMWTHGNTWILYYICPMHTFYFVMVYLTMFTFSSLNYDKWGIRFKLMVVAIIIFIIWDINYGLFDFLFGFLGTESVIGATTGSVYEYYFRTSLDHWSSLLGMVFAINFPLSEQYFHRAQGRPLIIASVIMFLATVWWLVNVYTLEKFQYNLVHSYYAIIPLTSYIFFRNITPAIRSGVSMSLHELGKTTLETYLLQHHIWLTSNAKTLLTIVPGHPWINFALATLLFFFVSKELYRLTMSLRGMIVPDDKSTALTNIIGLFGIFTVLYIISYSLYAFETTLLEIVIACLILSLISIMIINRFSKAVSDNIGFQFVASRAASAITILTCVCVFLQIAYEMHTTPEARAYSSAVYHPNNPECFGAISQGHWVTVPCEAPPSPQLDRSAYCETDKWIWDQYSDDCPVASIPSSKAKSILKGKKILFMGDSIVRNTYHQLSKLVDPSYKQAINSTLKHSPLSNHPKTLGQDASIEFVWTPQASDIADYLEKKYDDNEKHYDLVVFGATLWDALHTKDVNKYSKNIQRITNAIPSNNTIKVWLQPTKVIDALLSSSDKQNFMNQKQVDGYVAAFLSIPEVYSSFQVIVDPTLASDGREVGSSDGVHYGEEVYAVMSQMIANAYALNFPNYFSNSRAVKQVPPKVTGSMSFPSYGAFVLLITFIMLFTMDGFLGMLE